MSLISLAQTDGTCNSLGMQWYSCPDDSFNGCCSQDPCELKLCPEESNSNENITLNVKEKVSRIEAAESNVALIAGAVSGVVLAILIAAFVSFFVYRKKKRNNRHKPKGMSISKVFGKEHASQEKHLDLDRSTSDSSLLNHTYSSPGIFEGFDGRYSASPEHLDVSPDDFPIPDVEKIVEPPIYAHPAYRSTDSPTLPHPGSPVPIPHMPSPSPVRHQTEYFEYDSISSQHQTHRPSSHGSEHFGLKFPKREPYRNSAVPKSESRATNSRYSVSQNSTNTLSSDRNGLYRNQVSAASSRPEMFIEVKPFSQVEPSYRYTFYEERSPTPFP
ncbi:hypothetical protein K3495_g2727 [Podosphaera aphanis]|nr:hypothetical protein K3495_g2727 [Podosphaera aphanis]